MVLHFNGRQWAQAAVPRTPNWATLSGVAARSASDVWAVGSRSVDSPPGTERRCRTANAAFRWHDVAAGADPRSGGRRVGQGRCRPAGAVYAVGGYLGVMGCNLHTAGSSFVGTATPGRQCQRRDRRRRRAARHRGHRLRRMGVGDPPTRPVRSRRWRGASTATARAGRPIASTHTPGAILNGVHATSPTEVWAAGTPGNDGSRDGVLLTRWNGTGWQPAFRIPAVPALRGLADVTTAGGHVFSVGGPAERIAVQNSTTPPYAENPPSRHLKLDGGNSGPLSSCLVRRTVLRDVGHRAGRGPDWRQHAGGHASLRAARPHLLAPSGRRNNELPKEKVYDSSPARCPRRASPAGWPPRRP